GPTYANAHGHAEPVAEPVDPELLCRRAKRNQQDLRAVLMDELQRLGVLGRIGSTGVRGDLERRVGRTQSRREIAGHTWSRAEKKQLETTARAHRREGLDQVHTRDGLVHRAG